MKYPILFLTILALTSIPLFAKNTKITSFGNAKGKLASHVYGNKNKSFYCNCDYQKKSIKTKNCGYLLTKYKKRAKRIEWEHIVPAHAFGQSFKEWRNAKSICGFRTLKSGKTKSIGGRKCASKKNKLFRYMEADIYNLVPAVGAVNALRSNYSMAELSKTKKNIVCSSGMYKEGRKVMPPNYRKGDVARIYMYMDSAYPGRGIISKKNKKLFVAWDKMDPVSKKECQISRAKAKLQGNNNPFVIKRCKKRGL